MPDQQPDDLIVTLQARAIADLEEQLSALHALLDARDQQLTELERTAAAHEALLAVYQRSRFVRLATTLKRAQRMVGTPVARKRAAR